MQTGALEAADLFLFTKVVINRKLRFLAVLFNNGIHINIKLRKHYTRIFKIEN